MLAALVVLAGSSAALVMPRSRSHVVCRMPSLSPLPPALAASDGSHTFTYDSVQRRLPLIVESVIESNAYDAATVGALRGLAGEIAAGAPLKPLAAASDEWAAALAPCLVSVALSLASASATAASASASAWPHLTGRRRRVVRRRGSSSELPVQAHARADRRSPSRPA